uniref:phage tail tip domain-containing protein n=1 Tax=Escherichia coli TaxID=562 RepID=UPI002024873E
QVETSARYLGTGSQWSVSGPHIKPGKDFWFYVRSVNLVGKSAFVEASGRASNDAEGYLGLFREKIGKLHLAQGLWELIDNSQLADEMAEMKTSITETRNEITQTVSKTLEDQSATIQQIQRVQKDTNDDLAALYMLKVQKTKNGIPYVAGIGAGIEDTDGQPLSNILLLADRIAMINPEDGNTTPLFVAQGNQLFMNDVFLKRLFAASITSSGNPPTFSLTPEGKLTARNADISGAITANTGTLNNVTINENCVIRGKLSANQIEGDIVKTVSKSFPRTNSYASGTITVRISDDQKFDRQVMIPPVLFRGGKHENFNSNNQQSYWYSTCRLRVTRNGQEIFNQSTTDAQGVFSSVIDMPAGHQIEGDIVKTVSKSFPRTNSYASGTITVRISDDQKFDRQVMIPPVLFRGGKHENFNSNNQQSYWYSTCRLRVTRNGQEIFNQSTTDAQGVFSSVIDMPAGQGTLTLTFTVSSSGANNWTPTTSISDLLVVVMKKSTAGISIS